MRRSFNGLKAKAKIIRTIPRWCSVSCCCYGKHTELPAQLCKNVEKQVCVFVLYSLTWYEKLEGENVFTLFQSAWEMKHTHIRCHNWVRYEIAITGRSYWQSIWLGTVCSSESISTDTLTQVNVACRLFDLKRDDKTRPISLFCIFQKAFLKDELYPGMYRINSFVLYRQGWCVLSFFSAIVHKLPYLILNYLAWKELIKRCSRRPAAVCQASRSILYTTFPRSGNEFRGKWERESEYFMNTLIDEYLYQPQRESCWSTAPPRASPCRSLCWSRRMTRGSLPWLLFNIRKPVNRYKMTEWFYTVQRNRVGAFHNEMEWISFLSNATQSSTPLISLCHKTLELV